MPETSTPKRRQDRPGQSQESIVAFLEEDALAPAATAHVT